MRSLGVPVILTDDEFSTVFEALRFANSGWTDDDVTQLVLLEAKAWEVLQSIQKMRPATTG